MKLFGEKKWDIDRIWRLILGTVVLVVGYIVLSTLRGVLLPFAAAFILAYLLSPVIAFLERHRWKRVLAVLVVLVLLFGLIVVSLVSGIPRIVSELAFISTEFANYVNSLYEFLSDRVDVLEIESGNAILDASDSANGMQVESGNAILDAMVAELRKIDIAKHIRNWIFGIFHGVVSLVLYLASLAIIPIAAFFFLCDFQSISEKWKFYIPKQLREKGVPFINEVNGIISAFYRGQFLIVMILSLLFAAGFSIIGVPLAIVMGVMIGLLNLIPYFGTLVGIIPLALLTLGKSIQLGENPVNRLLGVAAVMVVVQMIQDWVLTPQIMKDRVGLKPITILMSALIWGKLLGFTGLLLAIPLSAIIKVYFLRYFLIKEEIEKEIAEDKGQQALKIKADEQV